jgi:hypothetical protein
MAERAHHLETAYIHYCEQERPNECDTLKPLKLENSPSEMYEASPSLRLVM